MSDETPVDCPVDGAFDVGDYARRAYLDYAMSVVTGRALPMLPDGQKPVQRRIIYGMHRMGLDAKAKPAKCARFVGDVMGKYHPHGDSSIYEAAVRMSQDFSLRYPLIDGQGNFGSRDGDGAAAMRYTEARLTPISELLLAELDQGTVDFRQNYDGTMQEPTLLPARLPMLLLNGASGIAVGMATEIPSHNLTEVAAACSHLIKHPDATLADLMQFIPGPDFPGGAQLISSPDEVTKAYATGRGSLRMRARWTVEQLAKGHWQIAIYELPFGTSTAKVMAEIEALSNPPLKAGKKTLTQDQANLKSLVLSVVDRISDDSDGEHPVRLIIEPRSSRQKPDDVMQVLLAHTSLECNFPMNLVTLGLDGKPAQKGLVAVLQEWASFRFTTVTRRTEFKLGHVQRRMHILEGRMTVFLHLDEVIHLIRTADSPKDELMSRFKLSDEQATDILEIRLRQLANLEYIKLQGELEELKKEEIALKHLLANKTAMTKLILSEIEADKKKYGDSRRTLIETAARVTLTSVQPTADEPVTLLITKHGWLRARTGHKADLSGLTFKPGDELLAVMETRTSQTVVFFDTSGRAYNVQAAAFPTGRGDGIPLTSLVDMGTNKLAHAFVLDPQAHYLLASSGGYGFLCPGLELVTRQKAGKVVMTLGENEHIFTPCPVANPANGEVVVASSAGKLLVFPLSELKVMPKGKGVQLMSLGGKFTLVSATAFPGVIEQLTVAMPPAGRKKLTEAVLAGAVLAGYRGSRARVGLFAPEKGLVMSCTATLSTTEDYGDGEII